MSENKLPDFGSIDELVQFFDTHDMGVYQEELPETHFDVDIKKQCFLISVNEELMKKLSELARAQHTTTEALVNAWLKEKVAQAA
jgi:hypothetical protein